MPKSAKKSKSRSRDAAKNARLAKVLAPEDVRAGHWVTLLTETTEWPSWYWCGDDLSTPREQAVRIVHTPSTAGVPLKVAAVCLPFILAKAPCGASRTLDVRHCRLARLDSTYAKAAAKALRPAIGGATPREK
jgi:hypothetical protein